MTEPARQYVPRLIAWETTRACPLACRHCRASAAREPAADELTTAEAERMLAGLAAFARPTLILTGGEPMLRKDIYHLAARARELGLRPVIAPCGLLLTDDTARRLADSGIDSLSISLDGATAESHDAFRGVPGAFDGALRGIEAARGAGLSFQVNTTVTRLNVDELPAILRLAVRLGASVFNPFLLVPTGRGREIADLEISPERYEETLHWLADQQGRPDIGIRVTCAPHYQRILRQTGAASGGASGGCLGGKAFAFVSSVGKVQICGFLDLECGDLRREGFDFRRIWETSEVFRRVRDVDGYGGRCGRCEFRAVCGGCRARAFATSGDYLAEEPFCVYEPRSTAPPPAAATRGMGVSPMRATGVPPVAELDELDRRIVSAVQASLPLAARPYAALAETLCLEPAEVMDRLSALRSSGVLRRIGPVFDSRSLGYVTTLVAAQVESEHLEATAEWVSSLAGVTHNYERQHEWNLWFTLTARQTEEIDRVVAELRRGPGVKAVAELPARTVYKIRAVFDAGDGKHGGTRRPPWHPRDEDKKHATATAQSLDAEQKRLVRLLQDDLPLVDEPFAEVAAAMGWTVDAVLDQLRRWLAQGVVRRFGAVARHQELGLTANGMAAFAVSEDRIDDAGRRLAACDDVTHLYRRRTPRGWPWELFAMVHGRSAEAVRRRAAEMAAEAGAADHVVLFSVREFKKTSPRYFLEDDSAE